MTVHPAMLASHHITHIVRALRWHQRTVPALARGGGTSWWRGLAVLRVQTRVAGMRRHRAPSRLPVQRAVAEPRNHTGARRRPCVTRRSACMLHDGSSKERWVRPPPATCCPLPLRTRPCLANENPRPYGLGR